MQPLKSLLSFHSGFVKDTFRHLKQVRKELKTIMHTDNTKISKNTTVLHIKYTF